MLQKLEEEESYYKLGVNGIFIKNETLPLSTLWACVMWSQIGLTDIKLGVPQLWFEFVPQTIWNIK